MTPHIISPAMEPTLYLSDLDGTLLGADSRVSEPSARMLREAVASGALFSIATARTPATVETLMAGVTLRLPAIVMTGAALWHQDTRSLSDQVPIADATAAALLEAYTRHDMSLFIYVFVDGRIDIYHRGPLSDVERRFMEERSGSRYKRFLVPPSGFSEIPGPLHDVALLYSMQPDAKAAAVWRDIRGRDDCTPLYYHDIFGPDTAVMEVFARNATKADAARRLRDACGARRVVAFGDNVNDLPLLRAADVAVAVGNAVPEVRETADIVIGPNTSDSVARFILRDYQSGGALCASLLSRKP